jgi:hypothetical protein
MSTQRGRLRLFLLVFIRSEPGQAQSRPFPSNTTSMLSKYLVPLPILLLKGKLKNVGIKVPVDWRWPNRENPSQKRGQPRIERGTTYTLSRYYTTKPLTRYKLPLLLTRKRASATNRVNINRQNRVRNIDYVDIKSERKTSTNQPI